MDLRTFIASLRHLDEAAIVATATALDARASSAAGEVAWWQATVEIDRLLKAHRAGRVGAKAAIDAAAAVLESAQAVGMVLPDPRVTTVARAAADVARGLSIQASAVEDLLRDCHFLLAA